MLNQRPLHHESVCFALCRTAHNLQRWLLQATQTTYSSSLNPILLINSSIAATLRGETELRLLCLFRDLPQIEDYHNQEEHGNWGQDNDPFLQRGAASWPRRHRNGSSRVIWRRNISVGQIHCTEGGLFPQSIRLNLVKKKNEVCKHPSYFWKIFLV